MTCERLPCERGVWTTPPHSTRVDGERLIVEAVEGSDYWRDTLYGFRHEDGHALLAPWEDTHAVEVSFRLTGFSGLYDQAGLMLWRDDSRWIKAGIEVNDGEPHLAVVVTDGHSDWSLAPVPDWVDRAVTVRASRLNDAVVLRARVDAEPWRTVRVARFDHPSGKQAGPYLCAPTRAGFRVAFTRWAQTVPDTELHADPP
ncbi:MAG TPA: DUF1349 domain-containing protein [Thermomicrobiales bacterium]|nr:DUF1349 domain-containing protein [Thermomicrobiales bacterium]